jgi:hypothetical protein
MKYGMVAFSFALFLGLLLTCAGCSKKKEPNEVQDINSVRAELKEQVDRGKLTEEQAIVRLAEAQVKYGSKKKEEGSKLPPELEALSKELKGKVEKGELTEDEAKAAWIEAAGEAKNKTKSKANKYSEKGKG